MQPLGKVLVVEDIVPARLPLRDIHHLNDKLPMHLSCTTSLYDNHTPQAAITKHDPSMVSLLSHLLYTGDTANFSVSAVVSYMLLPNVLHTSRPSGRIKRDLFDIGGMFLGKASDLAMEDDVHHVNGAMATLTDAINQNAQVL